MVGYVAYAELFGGTLKGVADRLDYLSELQVRYFHLMKVLRAREGANDGGYAVRRLPRRRPGARHLGRPRVPRRSSCTSAASACASTW